MRKGYLFGMYRSFLCMIIVTLAACNSNQTATTSTDTVAATADTPAEPKPAPLAHMSGFLNILYTDSATFVNLRAKSNGKITFRFLVVAPDNLTLGGWKNIGNSPNYPGTPPNPDITLKVGGASAYEIAPGNYFGNLVLYNQNIKNIEDSLAKNNGKFILFVPMDPAKTYGQITYKIHIVSTDPNTLKWSDVAGFAPTGDETNPSPPRGALN